MPLRKLSSTKEFIVRDLKDNPVRFALESIGMFINFTACIIMAMYAPTPPMVTVYLFFLVASVLLLISALTRGSTGFTIMYIGFIIIDGIGLYNSLT